MPKRDLPDEILSKIGSYMEIHVPTRLELLKRKLTLKELKDVAAWIEMLAKDSTELYLPAVSYKVSANQAIYIRSLGYTTGWIINGYYRGSDYETYCSLAEGFIIKI